MFLLRVCQALNEHKVPFAIVGGHAVALHGAVRGTIDIDFVIQWNKTNLLNAEQAINDIGLVSRLPITASDVFENRDQYIKERNLIAWNFYNPERQDEQLDLIISYDLGPNQSKTLSVESTHVPILDINSLIDMKTESGRPQDLADVEALKELSS